MLKVELHAHSGDDPSDRIPYSTAALIDRAAAHGYDALAITLHDRQLDLGPYAAQAADRGLVLIRGIERTVAGRHVLLLNFDERAERVASFDDVRALKAAQPAGLVVAPHAFFPGATCLGGLLDEYADLFDAVEYNAMFTRSVNFNRRAVAWAARHGRPVVGNGDIHRLHQFGTCYSLVDAPPDPDAICAAVRAGRVEYRAAPLSWATVARTLGSLLLCDAAVRAARAAGSFGPMRLPDAGEA